MGMDLYEKHRVLTAEQYNKLMSKELYFNNTYDLNLINAIEAEQIKKALWFDRIEAIMKDNGEKGVFIEEENSLTEYCEKNIDLDPDDEPLTLQEFLDAAEYSDGFISRYVDKIEIEGKTFYLLIDIYCGW